MDPITSLPFSSCTSQYNVGTLDAVGVTIVWFTILRWIALVAFGDDINAFIGLRDPKCRGKGWPEALIHVVLFLMAPIYTIVQAANCGDAKFMKLNITAMVFLIIYELIFCGAKNNLRFEFLGYCCGITFPDIMLVAVGFVAIVEGGQWRALGIATIVLVCLLSN